MNNPGLFLEPVHKRHVVSGHRAELGLNEIDERRLHVVQEEMA